MSVNIVLFVFSTAIFLYLLYRWLKWGDSSGEGNESIAKIAEWKTNVPYTRLISEIIHFTGPLLSNKNIKKYPTFKIYYYKHRKFAGFYNSIVVIYLKSNPNIPTLVNTVLHEIMHYTQSQTDKQYKRYDEFTNTYGYWENPFEKQARAWAAQNSDACIKYLASKQLIVKKQLSPTLIKP